jgi:segregation and condensation protein B
MKKDGIVRIIEAALFTAESPLSLETLQELFKESDHVDSKDVKLALEHLSRDCDQHSYELREVSGGYRMQLRADYAPYITSLWPDRTRGFSLKLLELLSLIAYRQPITRADMEHARGAPISAYFMRILQDHKWVKVVGQAEEIPGKPVLYGTTSEFLDYFNIKTLEDLPALPQTAKAK